MKSCCNSAMLCPTNINLYFQVVVFCFSKNRVDQSADSLTAIDLTTGTEKSDIYMFCQKAFSRLKGSDRRLPQVCEELHI